MNREASDFESGLEGTQRPFLEPRGATSATPLPEVLGLWQTQRGSWWQLDAETICPETDHIPAVAGPVRTAGARQRTLKIPIINCDTTQCTAPTPAVPAELGVGGAWLKTEALQHGLQLGWWRPRG